MKRDVSLPLRLLMPILALALAGPGAARAADFVMRVDLPTAEVALGEPVVITVTRERSVALKGTVEVEAPAFPGFEIDRVEPGEERAANGTIVRSDRYTLIPATAGTFEIEIPGFTFHAEDGHDFKAAAERRTLVVRDVPDWEIDALDVRDIKGPVGLPPARRGGGLAPVLAVLLLLLGAVLLARRLRRPPAGPPVAPPPPPVDAWREFEEDLRRLAGSGLLQRGDLKEYIERLSMILRVYLGRRYAVPAPDMTGEELAAWSVAAGGALEERILRFVDETDLVKFAKAPVGRPAVDELAALALDIARRAEAGKGGDRA